MLEILQRSYIGILEITFGIGIIIFMTKRPKSYPLTSVNFKGYAGGIAFVLVGIIYLLNEFNVW